MEEITSLDELVEERTATFGFEVINDCGASTKASSEFGAGPQASALFTFDLPRVPVADAKRALDFLQDLGADGQPIKLDLPASLSCLVVRYLKKKAVSRQDIAPADWPKFVRACDYLGLPELPAAVTNDATIAFVSALTIYDAVEYIREARICEVYAQFDAPADTASCVSKVAVADLVALLADKFRCSAADPGSAHLEMLLVAADAAPGEAIRPLNASFLADWTRPPHAIMHTVPYPRIGGRPNVNLRGVLDLGDLFDKFPWTPAGAAAPRGAPRATANAAYFVLVGAAVLRGLMALQRRWVSGQMFGRRVFDLCLIGRDVQGAFEALARMAAWVEAAAGPQHIVQRTESAVEFVTAKGTYRVWRYLFQSTEHAMLAGPAGPALAFDGAAVWTTGQGERELRLRRVLADPVSHGRASLLRALSWGFDVAAPGLGPRAAADLSRLERGPVAQHVCRDLARTVLEQVYAGGVNDHGTDETRGSDYEPGLAPIADDCAAPLRQRGIRALHRFVDARGAQIEKYGLVQLQLQSRAADEQPRIEVMSRNLSHIFFTCDGDTAAAATAAARAAGRAGDPSLAYVPAGAPASRLTFAPPRRRRGTTAAGWFPSEQAADARIRARKGESGAAAQPPAAPTLALAPPAAPTLALAPAAAPALAQAPAQALPIAPAAAQAVIPPRLSSALDTSPPADAPVAQVIFHLVDGGVAALVPARAGAPWAAAAGARGDARRNAQPLEIALPIEIADFCLVLPYLLTGRVPARAPIPRWAQFAAACAAVGAPALAHAVSDDAELVFLSALTAPHFLRRETETFARKVYQAAENGANGAPFDVAAYRAEIAARYAAMAPHCAALRAVGAEKMAADVTAAAPGSLLIDLGAIDLQTPAAIEKEYPYVIHGRAAPAKERDAKSPWGRWAPEYLPVKDAIEACERELPGFPWFDGEGAPQLALCGGAPLKFLRKGRHGAARGESGESADPFANSDLDFFLVGRDPASARAAIAAVHRWVAASSRGRFIAWRSSHAATFVTARAVYQIVLRLNPSAERVLLNFDLDQCCVGFLGARAPTDILAGAPARLFTTPRGLAALRSGTIIGDPERQSTTFAQRAAKASARGYALAFPGLLLRTYDRLWADAWGAGARVSFDTRAGTAVRARGGRAVADEVCADPARSMIEKVLRGGPSRRATDPLAYAEGDYAPAFGPIGDEAHSPFAAYVVRHARLVIAGRLPHIEVFTRSLAALLDAPAGARAGAPAGALRAALAAADPDYAYVPPGAPGGPINFVTALGHGQLAGSVNPVSMQSWLPDVM